MLAWLAPLGALLLLIGIITFIVVRRDKKHHAERLSKRDHSC
ncbi:MAG: hypothetical protein U5L76_03450 [Patescibacteria group bacterium]|nr:hypothetical protein [Patescibacteria group bacterium]